MKKIIASYRLIAGIFLCFAHILSGSKPRVTIVIVIDQFPYHAFQQTLPHLHGGIKYLARNGIQFTNALYPHALPATATGHAALNTGTYAKNHGIVANNWFDQEGKKIAADDDFSGDAIVFGSAEKIKGKSACNLMVDGVSDTIMLYQNNNCSHAVFALSLKSRAAIMCAGHLGKAIWFDTEQGLFTSSKAYFSELPDWLTIFNQQHKIPDAIPWTLMHHNSPTFYGCQKDFMPNNYTPKKLADTTVTTHSISNGKKSYSPFTKTPAATKLLLEAAQSCLHQALCADERKNVLLWVSLSSTDFIGHQYGNHSIEYIDMLYQIDHQLEKFMQAVHKLVPKQEIAWVLTSDHGAAPTPEFCQQKGYLPAHRITVQSIQEATSNHVSKDFGITSPIFRAIDSPNMYFSSAVQSLDATRSEKLVTDIIMTLTSTSGIKRAWSYQELNSVVAEKQSAEFLFKQQLYPERSGDIIFLVDPYCLVSSYPGGTSHETPYAYDRHVPLIVYQKGLYEQRIIQNAVDMLQVAPSLAHIMQVPKPSTCVENPLACLIPTKNLD